MVETGSRKDPKMSSCIVKKLQENYEKGKESKGEAEKERGSEHGYRQ